ncbi:MAG: 3-oxo-5-alpha-steroid 4-dehydrogenase [Spirochaetales bacterium]|nr:3-oxo-5-alpha-steroid 4-dehydrogenase [Spirochaetales bacterium]
MLDFLYSILVYLELGIGLCIFIILLFISAPYGRHYRSGWGISIPARAAWFGMEFPAFAVILIFFIIGTRYLHPVSIIFLIIWEIHYIQRTFIYPARIVGKPRNFPLLLAIFAFIFNVMNGFINGYYLFYLLFPYPMSWLYDPRFIAGTLLFFTGFFINLKSDNLIRKLKIKGNGSYVIPEGWLYELISSPNYLGEIIEWIGWACLTWSLPGVVFAIFTIANLFPRALSHHRWYKKQFPEYPEKRKAIIPFLL